MCTKYEGRDFLCSSYVHTVCFLITILFKLCIWVFDNPSDWHLSLVKPVWVQIVAAVHVWRNARVPKLLLCGEHFVDRLADSDAKTFHSNCSIVMNNDQFYLLCNQKAVVGKELIERPMMILLIHLKIIWKEGR